MGKGREKEGERGRKRDRERGRHPEDLCGHLQKIQEGRWRVLSLPALRTDESGVMHALWPNTHSVEYLLDMRKTDPVAFESQFMQNPLAEEGLMYDRGFQTYTMDELPQGVRAVKRWAYVDTADTGGDYLVAIAFINTPEFAYITDVVCSEKSMEVTERMVADMLHRNDTVTCRIESNNGGRGFSRNVHSILRGEKRNFKCALVPFTQTKNKKARIFSESNSVMSDIKMPHGWERRWPEFYKQLMYFRKDNSRGGQHDDAADAITGVFETRRAELMRGGVTINR